MMLNTNYQKSRSSTFRQEDFYTFSQYKPWPQGYNLNKIDQGPIGDANRYQISRV